jgi:transcriptional regulator with XRE-family HTH domain
MNTLLDNIKKRRNSKGYSQEYMAEKIGIATVNYGKIERGTTQMTINKLTSIATILEVDAIALLGESFDVPEKTIAFIKDIEEMKKLHSEITELDQEIKDYEAKLAEFTKRADDQDLLIQSMKNEREHIKGHLVMQMVSSYSFEIGVLNGIILNTEDNELKKKLLEYKLNIERFFIINTDYYYKTGFLSKSDFDKHYKDNEGFYPNIPAVMK